MFFIISERSMFVCCLLCCELWVLLFVGVGIINFDGVKDKTDRVIVGFYIRNNNGYFVRAGVFNYGRCNLILVAEVLELREGIREVKRMGFWKV